MGIRASASQLFRSCPMCGSSAVRTATREELGRGLTRWLSCCGACQTWRMDVLTKRESRKLVRHFLRDRHRMADALLQLSWADPSRELRAMSRPG